MTELLVDKHVKYFTLCMNMLPLHLQGQDNNKMSLIYFCLGSLKLLGSLNFTDIERGEFSQFIYDNYYIGSGFRDTMNPSGAYDGPTIASTFFGLSNLLMLEDPINEKVDREAIMDFLQLCQSNNGCFAPTLAPDGSVVIGGDLRTCYMAIAIRKILAIDNGAALDINVQAVTEYILQGLNFDGGFSSANNESHLGYTYCALAALKMLEHDFSSDSTLNWVVHRQVNYPDPVYENEDVDHEDFGGFNGRPNKLSDSCYGWWGAASLALLSRLDLADVTALSKFLLQNQDHRIGGISKDFNSGPDPYHAFLSVATLALVKDTADFQGAALLGAVDPVLTLPAALAAYLASLQWA